MAISLRRAQLILAAAQPSKAFYATLRARATIAANIPVAQTMMVAAIRKD